MIAWVIGATGVGKKTFIKHHACSRKFDSHWYNPYWIQDGEITLDELVRGASQRDLMIRWQWERDVLLRMVAREHNILQKIFYLTAALETRISRLESRGDLLAHNQGTLHREELDVWELVKNLRNHYKLTIIGIDCDQEYCWIERELDFREPSEISQ